MPLSRELEELLDRLDAAYRTMELEPDRDLEAKTVRAQWRRLAKRYHPDHHPDANEKMAVVNAARDEILADLEPKDPEQRPGALTRLLIARREHGDLDFDWDLDLDLDEDEPPPDSSGVPGRPRQPWVCEIVIAICGSGKSREFCRDAAADRLSKIVMAAPTTRLADELAGWLERFNCHVPVAKVHSAQGGDEVMTRIKKFWKNQDGPAILVITHKALLDMPVPPQAHEFAVCIDEVIDAFGFSVRSVGDTHGVWSRHCIAAPYIKGVLRLRPADLAGKHRKRLQWIANNPNGDEGLKPYSELAQAIVDPHQYVLVPQGQWEDLVTTVSPHTMKGVLNVATILAPTRFERWGRVLMMGARARKTMTVMFWERMFGVRFVPHPLQSRLPAEHANGHRLTIRYFFPERVTRSHMKLRTDQGMPMQIAICQAVTTFFGKEPFIWSLPQRGEEGGVPDTFWSMKSSAAFQPRLRIPGRSHGLNDYREIHNVALLSIVNLAPSLYSLMEALGITSYEVTECLGYAILHQDLLRSSLRDTEATHPVTCVVPDLPSAQALAAELPGARIEQMPADLIPALAQKKKPGPKPNPDDQRSEAEKARDRKRDQRKREREQPPAA